MENRNKPRVPRASAAKANGAAAAGGESSGPPRRAEVERKTRETRISAVLAIDGAGRGDIHTGVPFLDHMLESFARHGFFN